MKKPQFKNIILGLILVFILIWLSRLSVQPSWSLKPPSQPRPKQFLHPTPHSNSQPASKSVISTATEMNDHWNESFKVSFKKCFPNLDLPLDFNALLITAKSHLEQPNLLKHNWHIQTPSGNIKRFMLIPAEKNNQLGKDQTDFDLREYDVDSEGLPVYVKNRRLESIKDVATQIQTLGQIIYDEMSIEYILKNSEKIFIAEQNKQLKSIEWYKPNRAFLCQKESSCICRL